MSGLQQLLFGFARGVARRLRAGPIAEPNARPIARPSAARRATPTRRPSRPRAPRADAPSPTPRPAPEPMRARYDALARTMLARYDVRVRRWRTGMSGIAWCVTYRDATVQRLIEAPRPRGPMSAAVFLHEIGHHAIGFDVYKPRCLEEYHAWRFAIDEMERQGLNVTDAVRRRMRRSLQYAVGKARRRGIRTLPIELAEFDRPVEPARRTG